MEKWFIKNKSGDYKKIARDFKISEFLAKLLVNRQLLDYNLIDSFINPEIEKLHDPGLMKDMDRATGLIKEDIDNKRKIRIVGDFDVDGVMSVYILYKGLKRLGANVDYRIPDRVNDGYGINKEIVKEARGQDISTIITCDNGIAAIEEVKLARDLGLNIIVTDHHDQPFIVNKEGRKEFIKLEANAIVNPKQEDCNYPFKLLCGAAIAYKLIENLYRDFKIPKNEIYTFLEYGAIATICDVVDLVDENRIMVKAGLDLLNKTENIGLKALIRESSIEGKNIGVYHVGFIIGPSINATGRLDTALLALDLLLSQDQEEAEELAKQLRILNEERKSMTSEGVDRIINMIENTDIGKDKILVAYDPSINESVAGIIAGRIKEKFNKPTIVLTEGKDGAKGSARSIEEYNIYDELSKHKEIFQRFGGHPMAAGLSLDRENIPLLRDLLNKNTDLTEEDLVPKLYIDTALPIQYISFKLIDEISKLEPFGKGNSKPNFGDKDLKIRRASVLGKNRNVLKLSLISRDNKDFEAIYFGDIARFQELLEERYGTYEYEKVFKGIDNGASIDIIYYPAINEFNGKTSIQIVIESYRFPHK